MFCRIAVISTREHCVCTFCLMYIPLSIYSTVSTQAHFQTLNIVSHQPTTIYPEVYPHNDINTTSSKLEDQHPFKFLLQEPSNSKKKGGTRSDPFSQRLSPPDPTHAQNIEQMQTMSQVGRLQRYLATLRASDRETSTRSKTLST